MATETVTAIVQARMGSTRFPGKTLAAFARSSVLLHLLDRLRESSLLDIRVATSDRADDDAVEAACDAAGVDVFRGSATDVLARFADCIASRPTGPVVLRVCADRPLLSADLVDELLEAYGELGRPDYLSNNLPPSYPAGLDVELVRTDALLVAHREATDDYEREHVTPFVYRRPDRFRLAGLVCPFGNFSDVHLALDTREDYDRIVRLHGCLPERYDHRDVLTALQLCT